MTLGPHRHGEETAEVGTLISISREANCRRTAALSVQAPKSSSGFPEIPLPGEDGCCQSQAHFSFLLGAPIRCFPFFSPFPPMGGKDAPWCWWR